MKDKDLTKKITEWVEKHPKIICACGCKKEIQIRRHHYFKGIPKWRTGHSPTHYRWTKGMWDRSGKKHHNWKGGKWKSPEGYVHVITGKVGNHKYVREHRKIMEEKLGRKLKRFELVHHKNGIRDDNRLSNLQLLTWHNHRSEIQCPYCQKTFLTN